MNQMKNAFAVCIKIKKPVSTKKLTELVVKCLDLKKGDNTNDTTTNAIDDD